MTLFPVWRVLLRPRLVAACQLALASVACTPELPQLAWTVGFDVSVPDADRAAAINAWILRGGCDGEEHLHDFELSAGVNVGGPKTLPPGMYGFAAEARDDTCRPLAFGCVERQLPAEASGPIEIVLRASDKAASCEPYACAQGHCVGDAGVGTPDAGTALDAQVLADAALDAGGLDAHAFGDGETDAASDAGGDGGGAEDCPEGVRRPGGHCYYLYDLSLALADARELCELRGAHLVIFDDADEEAWVTSRVAPPNDFWLGITDAVVEGLWLTELGDLVIYSNWDAPNPNEGRAGNCARYYVPTRAWRDGSCTDQQSIICELP